MDGRDLLDTYRQILTGPQDGETCWWYLGSTFANLPGFPELPVIQAETIMVYRTETVSPDCLRIQWREVGYFRDPATGEPATTWLNPITGQHVPSPSSFQEGPACYTIQATPDGLQITLQQAHAKIISIGVTLKQSGHRLQLTQTEHKLRGFPLPDGTMPDPDSPASARCCTVLSLFANAAAGGAGPANCTGVYSFSLDTLPAWMGFGAISGDAIVKGVMCKAAMDERVNPTAWKRLQSLFPHFFHDGRVAPAW